MYNKILTNEEIDQILKQMEIEAAFEFWKIKGYLRDEYHQGKTEFRISFQSPRHFIIHPLNKDGKTIDVHF